MIGPASYKPQRILIGVGLMDEMRSEVDLRAPEEACGMVAGIVQDSDCLAVEVIPATNIERSQTSFRIDPEQQWRAFKNIEKQGLDLIAVFHSHPEGPDIPSPRDLAQAYYPEVVTLIWFSQDGEWDCRAFSIDPGGYYALPLLVTP